MTLAQLGWALVTLAAAALAAVGLHFLLDRIATRLAREGTPAYRSLLRRLRSPTRAASALVGLLVAFAGLRWPPSLRPALDELLTLAAIAVIAWLLTSATQAGVDMVGEHWDLGARDNLAARKAITRAGVVRRVLVVLILIVALAAMLMSFPEVRALGASLLASAGLVGLIAGLAAQPLLTNLIAGL